MENAIRKAIKLAGSQSALARVVGISPQAMGVQIRRGQITPEHCVAIEKAFPGAITRHELRPDHFGVPAQAAECVVIVLQNFQSESTTV